MSVLEQELQRLGVFRDNLPEILLDIARSIPSDTIPFRMKLAIAVSEVIRFTSSFKIPIKHWNNSLIPINAITFCIAKSGASKDSSVTAARKCFSKAYNIIEINRKRFNESKAIEAATNAGIENPHLFENFKQYLNPINPLIVGISTMEGFLQHLEDLQNSPIGSGYMYSGEIGAELSSNPAVIDCIKAIAELYDEGNKDVKILKDRTRQSGVIKNMPCSAMLIGSQANILFDENTKRKFKTEFSSKLARRSFFNFVNEDMPVESYETTAQYIEAARKREDTATEFRNKVIGTLEQIAKDLAHKIGTYLEVDDAVRDVYILYHERNLELAEELNGIHPMTQISRAHMQWKALKLAGALALLDNSSVIRVEHFKAGIEYTELLSNDLLSFEKELIKEPYEVFSDYVRSIMVDNKAEISLHNLRKLGYIPMKGNPTVKIKELVQLCTSYDNEGIYALDNDTVKFQQIVKVTQIDVSYKSLSGTKEQRSTKCADGFKHVQCTFDKLGDLLKHDTAYTSFIFKDGVRSNDNIISGCKWLILDVDNTFSTSEETHEQLLDINHYIVRTSNPDNAFKYRVIIELDSEIDVHKNHWKIFLKEVAKELGINADDLGKSQIYYSYADSKDTMLSTLDGIPLEVKPILDRTMNKVYNTSPVKISDKAKQNELLNNKFETFKQAFYAPLSQGRRKLVWAGKTAIELGADETYVRELLKEINDFWEYPMDDEKLNHTILNRIPSWFTT